MTVGNNKIKKPGKKQVVRRLYLLYDKRRNKYRLSSTSKYYRQDEEDKRIFKLDHSVKRPSVAGER